MRRRGGPRLLVRQWVLSVPERVRYFLHSDPAVQTLALHIFLSSVEQGLRQCSPEASPASRIGAIAFIHRFGGSKRAAARGWSDCCAIAPGRPFALERAA